MSNDSGRSLAELNDRIAIIRDNIRQLVEQAAAAAGAQSEERASARIDEQNAALAKLIAERDVLQKK
jgi:hypothetical protein